MSNFDEIFIKEMSPIDAYNYGRQMMEKELNEIHLCECNQIKAEAYEQGRADGLDMCIALFKEYQPRLAAHVSEFGDRLEQLKGAENEWF